MDDFNHYSPFTQFVYQLLAKPALHQAVHHLQHQSGFNINIVFYLVWLAKFRYGRLSKKQINLLQSQIALWHQRVLAELKYTHALLANSTDPAAIQTKHELQKEIEKANMIEQQMLFDTKLKTQFSRRSFRQQLADACASIVNYCEIKNDLMIEDDQAAFLQILMLVFDESEPADIQKQLTSGFSLLKTPIAQPIQMMWEEF